MSATTDTSFTFKEFLEKVAPGRAVRITDFVAEANYTRLATEPTGYVINPPVIELHCDEEKCGGIRSFKSAGKIEVRVNRLESMFLFYVCKNCESCRKEFAWQLRVEADGKGGYGYKFGEVPQFGPPTPARLIKLIGPQKDLFLKGRRSENQGLGIAAFAYYRRVIEDQKDRIFDEIIKVSRRLSVDQSTIDELTQAKAETQFSKAVESVKHGLPQTLLINGHNPLTLLHSALSEGLHAQTDEECLEIATSIREVMAEFAERMADALKDEAKLTTAVTRLLQKRSAV